MRKIFPFLLLSSTLFAADFYFAHPEHPWHLFAEYAQVGKADFRHSDAPCSHVKYSEGAISLYYSKFINDQNFVTFELGNNTLYFDWDENPRFRGKRYNTAIASVAFVTTQERWRWIFNPGATVDPSSFNFGNTGVYYGLVWGRYAYSQTLGFHIGAFGFYGIKNGYALPVLGIDWNFKPNWRLNLIFPLVSSLEYQITPNWVALLAIDTFGGPYRFPRRAHHGINGFENGIFDVFSSGVEAAVNYVRNRLKIEVGAGWNFGGRIHIKNQHNQRGKSFHYKDAPYGQANLAFTF